MPIISSHKSFSLPRGALQSSVNQLRRLRSRNTVFRLEPAVFVSFQNTCSGKRFNGFSRIFRNAASVGKIFFCQQPSVFLGKPPVNNKRRIFARYAFIRSEKSVIAQNKSLQSGVFNIFKIPGFPADIRKIRFLPRRGAVGNQ